MRKVCLLTSSRADLGILLPLCKEIELAKELNFSIIGFGAHCEDRYRGSFEEDTKAFSQVTLLENERASDDPLGACKLVASFFEELSLVLNKINPDIVLCLGDRYEMLAAVTAASIQGLVIAHFHGGEVTQGAFDDNFRHAITKLSHIHFPATSEAMLRIQQLGEQPRNIFNVGSLGVENVLKMKLSASEEIRSELKLSSSRPIIVITFHPETRAVKTGEEQIKIFLDGVEHFAEGNEIVFTGTNSDPGGDAINNCISDFASRYESVHMFGNLGVRRYLSLVKASELVIGNSSSGIIEVPSFHVPVVNVGDRQKGREKSKSVLDCQLDPKAIADCVEGVLKRETSIEFPNPYEGEDVKESVLEQLRTIELENIKNKNFYQIENINE